MIGCLGHPVCKVNFFVVKTVDITTGMQSIVENDQNPKFWLSAENEYSAETRQNIWLAVLQNISSEKCFVRTLAVHCWASRHSQGFEDKNVGSSPGLLGQ